MLLAKHRRLLHTPKMSSSLSTLLQSTHALACVWASTLWQSRIATNHRLNPPSEAIRFYTPVFLSPHSPAQRSQNNQSMRLCTHRIFQSTWRMKVGERHLLLKQHALCCCSPSLQPCKQLNQPGSGTKCLPTAMPCILDDWILEFGHFCCTGIAICQAMDTHIDIIHGPAWRHLNLNLHRRPLNRHRHHFKMIVL